MKLWHRLIRDQEDGPLPGLLIVLTLASGFIDAVSILRLGRVFAAAMTGNTLFIGFGLAGAPGFSLGASVTALGSFAVGSSVGAAVVRGNAMRRSILLRDAAGVQLTALVVASVAIGLAGDIPGPGVRYPMIAVLALAMGVQTAAVRSIGVKEITTTVLTTTYSTLIGDLRPGTWRSLPVQLRLLAVVVEVIGAVGGALLVLHVATWCPLAVAAVVVAAVVVAAHRAAQGAPTWNAHRA